MNGQDASTSGEGTSENATELQQISEHLTTLETEIRLMLRAPAQYANLSLVVIAAAITYSTVGATAVVYAAAAVLLSILGLSNLNSAIDAAALGELRDRLSARANYLIGTDVYMTGQLGNRRRTSWTSLSVYVLVTTIVIGMWVVAIVNAGEVTWRLILLAAAVLSSVMYCLALWELVTDPGKTRDYLDRNQRIRGPMREQPKLSKSD